MKIELDKYYTPKKLAKKLIKITFKVIDKKHITSIIEPSAGNGSFSTQLKCKAYDIKPEHPSIKKRDFLTLKKKYKKGRLCIGNPPFGVNNSLSVKFYKKCCELGDYIAFVQPISQLNNNLTMYEFDLIYSKDLGVQNYSGVNLHCCFNIYARPKSGKLNKKPNVSLKDCIIKEYRRGRTSKPKYANFGICSWGAYLGKKCKYVGEYASECWFYVRPKYLDKVLKITKKRELNKWLKSISCKRISMGRLYMYIKENIKGIK